MARSNLAAAYREAGRHDEAIEIFEKVPAARHRIFGADHPLTLMTRHGRALARLKAGRTAEAVADFEGVLADRLRILGPYHPDTRESVTALAAGH